MPVACPFFKDKDSRLSLAGGFRQLGSHRKLSRFEARTESPGRAPPPTSFRLRPAFLPLEIDYKPVKTPACARTTWGVFEGHVLAPVPQLLYIVKNVKTAMLKIKKTKCAITVTGGYS